MPVLNGLHKFQPVSERVGGIETFKAGNLGVPDYFNPRCFKTLLKLFQACNDERRMGFACRHKVRIDAEMNIDAICVEPAAASFLQKGWLFQPIESQNPAIESLSCGLSVPGHRQLHVI